MFTFKMKKLVFVFLLQYFYFTKAEKTTYTDYKIYSVVPSTKEQVNVLNDFQTNGVYDVWTDVISIGKDVRVMVSPAKQSEFVNSVNNIGLQVELKVKDVQELMDKQLVSAQNNLTRNVGSTVGTFNWIKYHSIAEINEWLDQLQTAFPGVVTTIVAGKSFEDRDIKGVKIDLLGDKRINTAEGPLTGMIEGGIHAREWISPATVTYIINEFLTSTDPNTRLMAEGCIWHIFPVINPDGYAYTFSGDRMWRKNRNTANFTSCSNTNDDLSIGVDLNRNFNFEWNTVGVSQDPCSQTFSGPSAASEPETQSISRYVLDLKSKTKFIYYLAFHSYSQMTLVPYSHVEGIEALIVDNYADLYEIGKRGADKLKARHGTQYTVGTSKDILYAVSGASFDWVKGVANVSIVYLFELRDVGEYGFLLPPEQIIPNSEEIVDCLVEIDRVTKQLGYYSYSGASSVFGSLSILISAVVSLLYVRVY